MSGTRFEQGCSPGPVRDLRTDLDRTKDSRVGKKLLCVSVKNNFSKDIPRDTVSHGIKKTILLAYSHCSEGDCSSLNRKAHKVRALATSWALYNHATVDAFMGACYWRPQTKFSSYYLRDLARIKEDMGYLGPVSAAVHQSGP